MENYSIIDTFNLEESIDMLYSKLLNKKDQFMIVHCKAKKYVLTKEKSIIPIIDEKVFLNHFNNNIYYKTIIKNSIININKKDLDIYNAYINKFKDKLTEKRYNGKYYFGCVAVKTDNGFITTIRGKKNLDEYTIIENVNHQNHIINAINKKATLNTPLLDYLFRNKKVKTIVHIHEFNNNLPYYDYAFPGTVKDSIRDNNTSFNIKYHGVIYMFDKQGNIL